MKIQASGEISVSFSAILEMKCPVSGDMQQPHISPENYAT